MKDIQTGIILENRGTGCFAVGFGACQMVAFGCNSSCFTTMSSTNLDLNLLRHPARP